MPEEPQADATDSDDDIAETFFRGGGPDKNEMTDKWLPGRDHWLVKTFLDRGDASSIVGIHAAAKLNPETKLDEINEEILPKHYEALVSENGTGFESHHDEIMAMHGGGSDDDSKSLALKAVAPDDE